MAFQINVLPLQHQILSNDMVLDKKAQELIKIGRINYETIWTRPENSYGF